MAISDVMPMAIRLPIISGRSWKCEPRQMSRRKDTPNALTSPVPATIEKIAVLGLGDVQVLLGFCQPAAEDGTKRWHTGVHHLVTAVLGSANVEECQNRSNDLRADNQYTAAMAGTPMARSGKSSPQRRTGRQLQPRDKDRAAVMGLKEQQGSTNLLSKIRHKPLKK